MFSLDVTPNMGVPARALVGDGSHARDAYAH
jgi:hypothetical protein